MVVMNTFDEVKYYLSYPPQGRELVSATPNRDGGTTAIYLTDYGYDTETWSKEGLLLSRACLDKDKAPLPSTTQPSVVCWDSDGRVTFVAFSPSKDQVEKHFGQTSAPLVTGHVLIAGQLLLASYYGLDAGQISHTFCSYYEDGVLATRNSYGENGQISAHWFAEDGTTIRKQTFAQKY